MHNQRLFRVTMIDDANLFERLTRELRFLIYQLRLGWAACKRDPVGFGRRTRAVQSLPFGLTERAIAAARMIRFRPATRDGRPVNVYMQLEYNFNLY